jgi:GH15 family glucan-1,4-alpha-glucosidase
MTNRPGGKNRGIPLHSCNFLGVQEEREVSEGTRAQWQKTMTEVEGAQPYATTGEWPRIEDYALIGDCRTAALVGRGGGIDWWCLPHFSGPAFFGRILDRRRGGCFVVRPVQAYRCERTYLGDSNVLQTRFQVDGGELRLTDALTIPSARRLEPQRELLRSMEAVGAEIMVEVVYQPAPDYGRGGIRLKPRGRLGWACASGASLLLLRTDLPLDLTNDGRCLRGRHVLYPGDRHYLSVSYVNNDIGIVPPLSSAGQRIADTVAWWEQWAGQCSYDGPYRAAVVRSALAIKLLTYCLSGAVVAAPTSSLPETIGGIRNWDYRYCWLRDASLTLEAFMDLGYRQEAEAFLDWLLHSTRLTWPKLQVLYDVHGHARIPEYALDHLEGYRGSRPVRVGNAAWNQSQLDVYGSVVMATATYVTRGGEISRDGRRMLVGFGKSVCRHWRRPDHGIWEMRGDRRHHTYSKVACWAALNCLIDLARLGIISVPLTRFLRERDALRAAVEAEGFNTELNSYVGTFNSLAADASLLLLPRYRFCDAADPKMIGTFTHLDAKLSSGALMYRYRHGYDELEGEESPFGICSFWAVDYLAQLGQVEAAERRFERLLSYGNDVGLFGEEIDAETGAAIGNFPQAFTHVGLINAAMSLARAGKSTDRRPT